MNQLRRYFLLLITVSLLLGACNQQPPPPTTTPAVPSPTPIIKPATAGMPSLEVVSGKFDVGLG